MTYLPNENRFTHMNDWYYCIEHNSVERFGECPAKNRLGPYETRDDANRALELAEIRNKTWDEDPKWNEDDAEPDEETES